MREFNKIVRDKIPSIIEKEGRKVNIKELSNDEYKKELNKKLQEEIKEYFEDNNVEELADIVEVIYGIVKSMGLSIEEFEKIRLEKVEKRGAFDNKTYLISSD